MFVRCISSHGLKGHNELFINNGNGTFTESAEEYGLEFFRLIQRKLFFLIMIMMVIWIVMFSINHIIPIENIVDTSHPAKI